MSEEQPKQDQAKQTPKLRNTGRPRCPYCKKLCESYKSDAFVTRYRCKEPNCSYTTKKARKSFLKQLSRRHVRREQEQEEGDFSAR